MQRRSEAEIAFGDSEVDFAPFAHCGGRREALKGLAVYLHRRVE